MLIQVCNQKLYGTFSQFHLIFIRLNHDFFQLMNLQLRWFTMQNVLFCTDIQDYLHYKRPTSGRMVNTGRRNVPSSIIGHACGPSHSEFSVVFSETHVNTR